jgi:hypothetical protein
VAHLLPFDEWLGPGSGELMVRKVTADPDGGCINKRALIVLFWLATIAPAATGLLECGHCFDLNRAGTGYDR